MNITQKHILGFLLTIPLYLMGLLDGLIEYAIRTFEQGFFTVTISMFYCIVYMTIAVLLGLFSSAYSSRVDLTVKVLKYRFNLFIAVGTTVFYIAYSYSIALCSGYVYLFITRVLF